MDFAWLLTKVREEWVVLKSAPGTFLLACLLAFALGFWFSAQGNDNEVSGLRSAIESLQAKNELNQSQMEAAEEEFEKVKTSLVATELALKQSQQRKKLETLPAETVRPLPLPSGKYSVTISAGKQFNLEKMSIEFRNVGAAKIALHILQVNASMNGASIFSKSDLDSVSIAPNETYVFTAEESLTGLNASGGPFRVMLSAFFRYGLEVDTSFAALWVGECRIETLQSEKSECVTEYVSDIDR